jgi:hypothetical protein
VTPHHLFVHSFWQVQTYNHLEFLKEHNTKKKEKVGNQRFKNLKREKGKWGWGCGQTVKKWDVRRKIE